MKREQENSNKDSRTDRPKENILSQDRNQRSSNDSNDLNEKTSVGTPGEIGPASLAGRYDDERAGGTGGRGANDGDTMSIRNDNAAHTNDHGTNPHQMRGNQQNNSSQGSNPSGNNERG